MFGVPDDPAGSIFAVICWRPDGLNFALQNSYSTHHTSQSTSDVGLSTVNICRIHEAPSSRVEFISCLMHIIMASRKNSSFTTKRAICPKGHASKEVRSMKNPFLRLPRICPDDGQIPQYNGGNEDSFRCGTVRVYSYTPEIFLKNPEPYVMGFCKQNESQKRCHASSVMLGMLVGKGI